MLELLGGHAFHRVEIYESDGAYADERLIAHLIQKNKQMAAVLTVWKVFGACDGPKLRN